MCQIWSLRTDTHFRLGYRPANEYLALLAFFEVHLTMKSVANSRFELLWLQEKN